MTKIVVVDYEISEVDFIDYHETDITIEDWLSKHYNLDNCYYLIADNQSLNIQFLDSEDFNK